MKIVVCVKQVADTNFQVGIDFQAGRPDPEDVVYIVNPLDKVALEAAARLKETMTAPPTSVTLITLGPPEAEEALRRCLTWGADEAVHLWDRGFENLDAFATAAVLAQAISRLGFDLILCGQQSLDGETGQVGPMIAERLDIPHVAAVTRLELSSDRTHALVHRRMERGRREVVRCQLPALLTVDRGLNQPRYPSFEACLAARRKEVQRWDASFLEMEGITPTTQHLGIFPPRPRPKKIFTPDSSLSAADRMKQMMSGGLAQKKSGSSLIEEDPEKAASQAAQFIIKEKIVSQS